MYQCSIDEVFRRSNRFFFALTQGKSSGNSGRKCTTGSMGMGQGYFIHLQQGKFPAIIKNVYCLISSQRTAGLDDYCLRSQRTNLAGCFLDLFQSFKFSHLRQSPCFKDVWGNNIGNRQEFSAYSIGCARIQHLVGTLTYENRINNYLANSVAVDGFAYQAHNFRSSEHPSFHSVQRHIRSENGVELALHQLKRQVLDFMPPRGWIHTNDRSQSDLAEDTEFLESR